MTRRKTGFFLACVFALVAPCVSMPAALAKEDPTDAVTQAAETNRLSVEFDGQTFSGAGYAALLTEAQGAHFFLLGEEHGIAENPKLAAQLFAELVPAGYRRLGIEISPPMASLIDEVLAENGLAGLAELFGKPGHKPAFFGMREEAEMLAAVRQAVPAGEPAFWGLDYEVAGDLALLRQLEAMDKPEAAEAPVKVLAQASAEGWDKLLGSGAPQHLFSFAGDLQLIRDVEASWPDRDARAAAILDALEETLEINGLWMAGQGYDSNRRRAAFFRQNFMDHWTASRNAGDTPRVMFKLGANHLVRGRNNTQTFDLGALLPELAEREGKSTFSVMVVPGKGSPTAVLNVAEWRYEPAPPKDNYLEGLDPLVAAAYPDRFTLVDLRPLRAVVFTQARTLHPALVRTVFGFDALLVMSGSTPSADFSAE